MAAQKIVMGDIEKDGSSSNHENISKDTYTIDAEIASHHFGLVKDLDVLPATKGQVEPGIIDENKNDKIMPWSKSNEHKIHISDQDNLHFPIGNVEKDIELSDTFQGIVSENVTVCDTSKAPSTVDCDPLMSPSPSSTDGCDPSTGPSTDDCDPSTDDCDPSTDGCDPSTGPSPDGCDPSTGPSTDGCDPSMGPSTDGCDPSTDDCDPSTDGCDPSTGPSPDGCDPSTGPSTDGCDLSTGPSPDGCDPSTGPSTDGCDLPMGPSTDGCDPCMGPSTDGCDPSTGPSTVGCDLPMGPSTDGCDPCMGPSPDGCDPCMGPSTDGCDPSTGPSTVGCDLPMGPSTDGCDPSTGPSTDGCDLPMGPSTDGCDPSTGPSTDGCDLPMGPSTDGCDPCMGPSPDGCDSSTGASTDGCDPSTGPSPDGCDPSTGPFTDGCDSPLPASTVDCDSDYDVLTDNDPPKEEVPQQLYRDDETVNFIDFEKSILTSIDEEYIDDYNIEIDDVDKASNAVKRTTNAADRDFVRVGYDVNDTDQTKDTDNYDSILNREMNDGDGDIDAIRQETNRDMDINFEIRNIDRVKDGVDLEISNVDRDMDGVDMKIIKVDTNMDCVDFEIEKFDREMYGVALEISNVDKDIDGVDPKISNVDSDIDGVDPKISNGDRDIDGIDFEIEKFDKEMYGVDLEFRHIDRENEGIDIEINNVNALNKDDTVDIIDDNIHTDNSNQDDSEKAIFEHSNIYLENISDGIATVMNDADSSIKPASHGTYNSNNTQNVYLGLNDGNTSVWTSDLQNRDLVSDEGLDACNDKRQWIGDIVVEDNCQISTIHSDSYVDLSSGYNDPNESSDYPETHTHEESFDDQIHQDNAGLNDHQQEKTYNINTRQDPKSNIYKPTKGYENGEMRYSDIFDLWEVTLILLCQIEMEGTRRHKDRSYRNVFKGSVLVGTLLDHDNGRFINRQAAVKFAQRLLDAGHIESIVGASTFEDSVHLYRWSDETVVREAKRMVSTTSSHIPRKKLIEMIDLNQVEDSEESFVMEDVKDKLFKKQNERAPPKTKEESDLLAARRARHRERARRRQTMDGSQLSDASTAVASYKDKERERGREKEKDKEREKDREKERDPESDSALHRTESVSSDTSGLSAITDNSLRMRTGSPSSAGVSESRRASNNSVTEVLEMRLRSPETTTVTSVASVAIVPSSSTSPTPSRAESVQSSSESTKTESTVLPDVSTCRYDGIEMPALDLDNISFETVRTRKNKTSMKALHRSLEDLAEQSHSYSDNEKQLLEQMKKMQQEHENVVNTYEDQINELMGKMDDLKILSQALETERKESASGTISPSPFPGVAALDLQTDGLVSRDSLSPGPMSPVGKGPPGPPVPPPPPPPAGPPRLAKPTKPPLKPRVKMRPLFWNRIILEPLRDKDKEQSEPTFWHTSTEPNFDVDEFEKLFGKDHQKELKKTKSLHDAMSTMKGKGRVQTAKILEENRSRQVAIKLLSMHCQMQDIRNAVYTMDFSKIDLESLYRLYEIRGTAEEVDKISLHIQANEDVPLDQPEQFLLELSQMSHFPERMECMMLRKRFNETLFNIDQQLSTVQQACSEIKNSEMLKTLLEFVLAFGNYMNGGTQRGQADGFDLSIMCKLKDVKSMDNNTNLLRHIVKIYMRDYEEDAGKNEAVFKLPDPAVLQQAAQVSFTDLDSDLNRLYHQLNTHSKKAELVCLDTDSELLQPFKDHMDDFFDTAEDMVKRQHQKLNNTKGTFQDQLRYMAVKDTTEQVTPDSFFSIFYQFIEDYKMFWKAEQKGIARDMFTKVEQKRKARMRSAKRRKSVIEDGKSNLKQKFAQMRKRSEGVTGQAVKFLRSQSVTSGIETDGSLRGSNESLASLAEDTQPPRRRRARSDIYEPRLVDENSNNPKTLNRMGSQEGKESMAERMRTRRRTRVSVEEMPATTRQESVPQRIRSRQTAAESPAAESNHDEPAPPAQRIRSRQPAAESSAAESNHEEPPSAERAYTRRRRSNQSIEDTGPGPNATDAAKSDVESMGPRRRRPTREDPAAAVDTDTTDDTSNQRTHYRRRRGSQDIRASHERPLLPSSPPPTGPPPHYMTRARSSQGNIFEDGQGTHHQRSSRASSPGRSSGRSSPELKVHNPRVRPAPLESDTDYDTDTASKIHYREALRKISRTQTGMFDQFSAVRVNREVSERKPEGIRERTRSRGESDKDTTAAPPWRSGRTRAGSFDA